MGDILSVDGDAVAAVEARVLQGWNEFRQLVPLFINKDISLVTRENFYKSCVHSCTLHGSETWPAKKQQLTLQRPEMSMIRWMCGIKATGSHVVS